VKRDPSLWETGTTGWIKPREGPFRTRRRKFAVILAVAVVSIAVLAALALVPVSHPYSMAISGCPDGSSSIQIPVGAYVVVHWYASGEAPVAFTIANENNVPIYQTTAVSGSYTFTVNQLGPTSFEVSHAPNCANDVVRAYGHFVSPVLSWLSGPD